jgi:dinuclear metal center YbgI/SA1388 family protein
MEKLEKIVSFLDTTLKINECVDSCWNGLQVEGRSEVRKIICAVDSGARTFGQARKLGADMVVVHHGHFWSSVNPSLRGGYGRRIEILQRHGISLYASHIPLDIHPTLGNNILLLKLLGARPKGRFATHGGKPLSFWGVFSRPVLFDDFVHRIAKKLDTACTVLPFGPSRVSTVGLVTGGGGRQHFAEAVQMGLDVFVTGEPLDIYHDASDLRMNVVFAGHHATETPGVKALAKLLSLRFRVETGFLDIKTGL